MAIQASLLLLVVNLHTRLTATFFGGVSMVAAPLSSTKTFAVRVVRTCVLAKAKLEYSAAKALQHIRLEMQRPTLCCRQSCRCAAHL
jgi:hypothetical protein